jgi:hypothetical protein
MKNSEMSRLLFSKLMLIKDGRIKEKWKEPTIVTDFQCYEIFGIINNSSPAWGETGVSESLF